MSIKEVGITIFSIKYPLTSRHQTHFSWIKGSSLSPNRHPPQLCRLGNSSKLCKRNVDPEMGFCVPRETTCFFQPTDAVCQNM